MAKFLTKARLASLVRFGIGGVLSSGVALGSTALLHELGSVNERLAAAVGLAAALTVNFVMLRFFVFRGTRSAFVPQLLVFLGSSGVFRGLEYAAFFALNALLHVQYLLAMVAVLGCSFILKFLVYEGWVFVRGSGQAASDSGDGGRGAP